MEDNKYIVICTKYGDTCDGHGTKLGTADTLKEACEIIKDDQDIYRRQLVSTGRSPDDIIVRINEIWDGEVGIEGRVYDVYPV